SMVARMLRNRYYLGFVTFKSVEYPGNHPALVDLETFAQVQGLLDDRSRTRIKQRTYRHYLRGQIFCGSCGHQLIFTRTRSRPGVPYDYFFCTGRREPCQLPYLRVDDVEEAIVGFWQRTICLPEDLADKIRQYVLAQVADEHADLERQMRKHRQ